MTVYLPLVVIVAMNLMCVVLTRRAAKQRGYDVQRFTVGALLCGPAALLAARQAHNYSVDESVVPSHVQAAPAELPAPAEPVIVHDVTLGQATWSGEEIHGPDGGPIAPEVQPVDAADDELPEFGDMPPTAADTETTDRPDDRSALHLTPWGTRAGDDDRPAAPKTLAELAAASKAERSLRRNMPKPQDAPEENENKGGGRRRLSLRKRGKNRSQSSDDRGDQQLAPPAAEQEVTVPNDPAQAVAPQEPTWGECPHCHTASYADHYGLCANCAGVFPVQAPQTA